MNSPDAKQTESKDTGDFASKNPARDSNVSAAAGTGYNKNESTVRSRKNRIIETKIIDEAPEDADIIHSKLNMRNSKLSFGSSTGSIGMSKYPHAQEVSETIGSKAKEVIGIIFSVLVLNCLLIAMAYSMSNGLDIWVPPAVVQYAGGVVVELILLMSNILTIQALDTGASIYIASLIVKRHGYSMAGCGFMQASPIRRVKFTGQLSLNSPCRKNLQRASYLWVLAELLKMLSPIGATGLLSDQVRTHSDQVQCIAFRPRIDRLIDRKYPTVTSEAGVAEYLFGNALGCMRSERSDCPSYGSQFTFGTQLNGVVGDGDTIVGPGFQTVIATTCSCRDVLSPSAISRGYLTLRDQQTLANLFGNGTAVPFIMRFSTTNSSASDMQSYSIIGNMNACGGNLFSVVPVCRTNISTLQDADVASTFMTDGTTASISLSNSVAEAIRPNTTNNIPCIKFALDAIWPEGQVFELVSNVAGMMNALLYWTSSDLVAIDATLLETGTETLYAIFLRGGIQRTWPSYGTLCTREISRTDVTRISLSMFGTISIYAAATIQLILNLVAFAAGSVWFMSDAPLDPAIRIIRNPTYFMSVLCESPFAINLFATGNAQKHVIWQALDIPVRIGESLDTIDEGVGRIKMERPRLVKQLKNGRLYA